MYLIYDTETTGLPRDWNAPITDSDNWPRCVQIAWQLHDELGELVEVKNFIIKPEGYDIPFNAAQIHGITTERAEKQGVDLTWALNEFNKALSKSKFVVGHNIGFDINTNFLSQHLLVFERWGGREQPNDDRTGLELIPSELSTLTGTYENIYVYIYIYIM